MADCWKDGGRKTSIRKTCQVRAAADSMVVWRSSEDKYRLRDHDHVHRSQVAGVVMILVGAAILVLLASFVVSLIVVILEILAVIVGIFLVLGGIALLLGHGWWRRRAWEWGAPPAST
ncbi:MAG TPA: hypothetical protein VEB87_02520 [Nitrososphaerales archaeon]|nr:hypothetical protein [Nitrososphaerales archaeon]